MLPKHGQVIIFDKVPTGSYCSAGVAYVVGRPGDKGDFRFERVHGGSATFDRPWAVCRASWRPAEA